MITLKEIKNKIEEAREYYNDKYFDIDFNYLNIYESKKYDFVVSMKDKDAGTVYKCEKVNGFRYVYNFKTTPEEIFKILNEEKINKIANF